MLRCPVKVLCRFIGALRQHTIELSCPAAPSPSLPNSVPIVVGTNGLYGVNCSVLFAMPYLFFSLILNTFTFVLLIVYVPSACSTAVGFSAAIFNNA